MKPLAMTFLFFIAGLAVLSGVTTAAVESTPATTAERLQTATFAGGCFWCVEQAFDKIDGVVSTTSGYSGGHVENPTYKQVSAGGTGHAEAIEVRYDPATVSYAELLETFWHNIDPTVNDRQFCDKGTQYRPAIFYHTDEQQQLADASKEKLLTSRPFDGPILTKIVMASAFYEAEEYHQDFYLKNPIRYNLYKFNCGRERRLKELWGKK